PCAVEGDCGACADGTKPACNQYLPMMGAKYNLFHPSFSDSNAASISNFSFICDATCTGGTAGQQCAHDSDCAGCSGGCVWAGGGGTSATPPAFLNDVTNKIGTAYNPNFTDISATDCQNGTDVTACDFSLAAGSAAIDAGSWPMLTNGAGTRSNTLVVKHNV